MLAVGKAGGREVDDGRETLELHDLQERRHFAGRVAADNASEDRGVLDDRENAVAETHDDVVGVAIGHQAGRLDTAQAQVARVEQADHVRTAALCKLCGNADASAGDDDGLTGVNRCLESLLDFLTGETFCHNASSLYS